MDSFFILFGRVMLAVLWFISVLDGDKVGSQIYAAAIMVTMVIPISRGPHAHEVR